MAQTNREHESGRPPVILTWGANALESRVPGVVRTLRATRDRTLGWRDSYAYRHYPEPGKPFGARYRRNHRVFIASALADSLLLDRIRGHRPLPAGYGVGLDERVVEFPWVLASRPSGRVLDAGSALNHPHVLDAILPAVGELTICTLAPESTSFPERGVSYVYADLRELPFRDGWFDTVVSISTLEHVGMDVRRWGAAGSGTDDPRTEVERAGAELRRVTRSGGRLLLTVPYGAPQNLGWLRQFDRDDLEQLVGSIGPRETSIRVFAYERSGWRVSSLDDSSGALYQAGNRPAADPEREDLAPAARAVACLELTV
jgi:SAM-dependent methyltransferase